MNKTGKKLLVSTLAAAAFMVPAASAEAQPPLHIQDARAFLQADLDFGVKYGFADWGAVLQCKHYSPSRVGCLARQGGVYDAHQECVAWTDTIPRTCVEWDMVLDSDGDHSDTWVIMQRGRRGKIRVAKPSWW